MTVRCCYHEATHTRTFTYVSDSHNHGTTLHCRHCCRLWQFRRCCGGTAVRGPARVCAAPRSWRSSRRAACTQLLPLLIACTCNCGLTCGMVTPFCSHTQRVRCPSAFIKLQDSEYDWQVCGSTPAVWPLAVVLPPSHDQRGYLQLKTPPEPGLGGRIVKLPRGRILGGCSCLNCCVYVRGHKGTQLWMLQEHGGGIFLMTAVVTGFTHRKLQWLCSHGLPWLELR